GVGVTDLLFGTRDVDSVGEKAARLSEVFGALDAEGAGDPAVIEVPDRELALVAIAAPDLLVPLLGRADVLEAGPVGEVAEEVGHHLVVGVLAEHVAGRVHALLHRHVPVLDADAAAVNHTLVGTVVAGRVDALGRGPQLRVAGNAVVDREPGALGEHGVRPHAGADDDGVTLDRQAALRDHALDAAVPLVGLELLAAV